MWCEKGKHASVSLIELGFVSHFIFRILTAVSLLNSFVLCVSFSLSFRSLLSLTFHWKETQSTKRNQGHTNHRSTSVHTVHFSYTHNPWVVGARGTCSFVIKLNVMEARFYLITKQNTRRLERKGESVSELEMKRVFWERNEQGTERVRWYGSFLCSWWVCFIKI